MNAGWISEIHREIKQLPVNVLQKTRSAKVELLPIKMAIVTVE
jgi:hypothetical protein